jgi:hypothetical protein
VRGVFWRESSSVIKGYLHKTSDTLEYFNTHIFHTGAPCAGAVRENQSKNETDYCNPQSNSNNRKYGDAIAI